MASRSFELPEQPPPVAAERIAEALERGDEDGDVSGFDFLHRAWVEFRQFRQLLLRQPTREPFPADIRAERAEEFGFIKGRSHASSRRIARNSHTARWGVKCAVFSSCTSQRLCHSSAAMKPLRRILTLFFCLVMLSLGGRCMAASLTIIAHGFQPATTHTALPWVEAMANSVNEHTGNSAAVFTLVIDRVNGVVQKTELLQDSGPLGTASDVIIKLYWDAAAGIDPVGEASTWEIAKVAVPILLNWPYGKTPLELPTHLIGHSRGGSLVSDVARRLGELGIWVEQMTTLDPRPVQGGAILDPSVQVWETVTFADNYFENDVETFPSGTDVFGAYNRDISENVLKQGGYSTPVFGSHSDIHFWYHGTVNTASNISNGDAGIVMTDALRAKWYSNGNDGVRNESLGKNTGYYFSRLGSSDGTGWLNRDAFQIKDGMIYTFAGIPLNRSKFGDVSKMTWPSVVNMRDTRSGKLHHTTVEYQDFDSSAHIWIDLDPDQNPYNYNSVNIEANLLVHKTDSLGTGSPGTGEISVDWNEEDMPAGDYWLYAFISDDTHERHFHRPVRIRITTPVVIPPIVTAPATPTNLTATAVSSSQINLRWTDNSTNETGFKLQRRPSTAQAWTDIPTTASANSTAFSNTTGLLPAIPYTYRVAAFNANGPSGWSDVASATTRPPAATVWTVAVVTEPLGVPAFIGITTDSTGLGSYTAPFQRTYLDGTRIVVTATANSGGKHFQGWKINGAFVTAELSYALTIDENRTADSKRLVAAYADGVPTRSIVSGAIDGPAAVAEGRSAQFRLRVTYSDGLSEYIPATWALTGSAATINPASGLLDAGSVSSDQQVDLRASFVTGGSLATSSPFRITVTNTNAVATYTLTRSATVGGTIDAYPNQSSYQDGAIVHLYANAADGYKFDSWGGAANGAVSGIDVRMNGNLAVTANFVQDNSIGSLRVDIFPPGAASPSLPLAERGQWQYRSGDLHEGGVTQGNIAAGSGTVLFKDIPGWIKPTEVRVTISGGQLTTASATYREILGAVQVTITPAAAATAGARWRLDGGAWTESGVTLADASTGTHTVEFLSIPGWTTPPSQSITVARGISTTSTGDYGPPAGFPIITSISPRTGPIDGGTTVTIDGVNFLPGATVSFGGAAATSVTVVNSTRITAVTPARASYGSVALALTSGGQTVTQANGFSYLNSSGSNIELVSQIGGSVNAVAVVGNTVYYNQGTGFVVADFTNSAAPVERGRITLPGIINDIAVMNGIAFVTTGAAGLYAVDVSKPTAPSIVGFFDTDVYSFAVAVSNGIAYVADAQSLQILNVSNPAAIVRLGQLPTAGGAQRICVGTIGLKKYAFVGEGYAAAGQTPALRVIDVTTPNTPVEVSSVLAESTAGITDVKLVGTKLYFTDLRNSQRRGVKIFDASNPANLTQLDFYFPGIGVDFFDVGGSSLYSCNATLGIGDLTLIPLPANVPSLGVGATCYKLVVANNLAFAAMGGDGLKVVAVSNPASMSLRSAIQTFGRVGDVVVKNGIAFIGDDAAGLLTFDCSNPTSPLRLGGLNAAVGNTRLVVTNDKAVLVPSGGNVSKIANVANPSTLTQVSTYTATNMWSVAIAGNTPILGVWDVNYYPMLVTLNTAVQPPQTLGSVLLGTTTTAPNAIVTSGNWAFVWLSYGDSALVVVNIANTSAPSVVTSVPATGYVTSMATSADGNCLYVADQNLGVRVVDITNKNAPVFGQVLQTPQTVNTGCRGVCVSGNRLVATEYGYVFVFDISAPASPQLVAYYDTPGASDRVFAVGDLIYVADDQAGVTILRLKDLDKPTVTISSPTTNTSYPTTAASLSLGGAASDDKGVVRVSWQNDRGGGDVAQGTSAWTIPAIQLAAGSNFITVTAEDAQGNLARDTITVTLALPDTSGPSIVVTGPNPSSAFSFAADTLTLTGTAADASGVQAVSWANDRGGSGTATGTSAWTASIPLFDGPNRITVTARDTVGNESNSEVLVTYAPTDATAPTVSVTFPTDQQEAATSEPMVNLSGEAEDNRGVTRVAWSNSRGGAGVAAGTGRWTANGIALLPGLNILTVTATDSSGNVGSDALAVTYTPHFSALALTTAGTGTPTLAGKPDLAAMEVGKLYTAEAKPAKGWIFAGWEGSVVSNSKRVSFVMEEGATLHAVFVENPYDEIAAVYRGLLRADPLAHSTSGDATLALTKSGAFTAQFTIGGEKLRLHGVFDGTGTFLGKLKGRPALDVLLALDTATADAPVTGLLSDGTTTMALNAWPTVSFSRATPAPQAAAYTLAIEPGTAPAPIGYGTGTARVSTGGGVKLNGRLANGAKFSAGTAITSGNRVPLYMSLDKGSSSFGAPLAFADKPDSDLDGIAFWSSAREASAKYPFAPFTLEPRFFAQRYTPPARGGRALSSLNATNGAATLTLGTHTQTLTLGTDNRLAFGNPLLDGFSMKLKAKTGEFSGSLLLDGERVKFGGVLMQKSGDGVGALPDAAVTLEP